MRVELYGDGIGEVRLIESMGSDLSIVNAARASFGVTRGQMDERDRKLVGYLMEHKHTSTLEHNVLTCSFTVPLFVRSQHHRHRTWSYNEISRRYTSEDLQFYVPGALRKQSQSNRQASTEEQVEQGEDLLRQVIKAHHADSLRVYEGLLASGVCREQARGVLPQNLYTRYWGTVNLNNALRFCELRLHEGAQWEIQVVAEALLAIMRDLWPVAVAEWERGRE
jgi:thymidylate synthase (FAD)